MNSLSPRAPRKGGLGCLFSGCLTALVLFGGIVVLTFYYSKRLIGAQLSDAPRPLPAIVEPADRGNRAREQYDSFVAGTSTSLTLSAIEVNYLISEHPQLTSLRDYLRVSFPAKNRVRTVVSLPGGELGFDGKYLNAEAQFVVVLTAGKLTVTLEDLDLQNWKLDSAVAEKLQSSNIMDSIELSPDLQAFIQSLKVLQIEKDSLFISKVLPGREGVGTEARMAPRGESAVATGP